MHPQTQAIIGNMVRNQQDEGGLNQENSIVILENWCGLGQRKTGVEKGANHLLQTLQLNHLPIIRIVEGESEKDSPDNYTSPETLSSVEEVCLNQRRVGSFNQTISQTITSLTNDKQDMPFIVNIGGDHSVAIGSIYAMLIQYPDLRVLWIDAHADINTPEGSTSKNMHGMPLAFLSGKAVLGQERKSLVGFEWMNEEINLDISSRLAYLGLRDVDDFEHEILKKFNILHFTASKVNELGIDHCLEECFSHLGLNSQSRHPLFLSFDVDGIDPEFTPSTGTAVGNGISHGDGLKICKKCGEYSNFVGMDLVEVNPCIGNEEQIEKTILNSMQYITTAIERKL